MTVILRLIAPAALLGAFLLLGERPANPPDELPAASISAAGEDVSVRAVPCPGLLPGRFVVALLAVRLPPAAAATLQAVAPPPEARALSPPRAV